MAINKKLIHFQTLANFEVQLSAGNILNTSICFIKDAKKIWTHGEYYDCESVEDVVKYTEQELTYEQQSQVRSNIGAIGLVADYILGNSQGEAIYPLTSSDRVTFEDGGYLTDKISGFVSEFGGGLLKNASGQFYPITTSDKVTVSGTSLTNVLTSKQESLVSGTNIKTINGESILGSGDITIEGGNSDANVQAVDTSETLEDVNTSTYVKYVAQTLTDAQKTQARTNIGVDLSSYATISYVNEQLGNINSTLESIING